MSDDRSRIADELLCTYIGRLPAADTLVRYAVGVYRRPVVGIATEPTIVSARARRRLPVDSAREMPIMDVCERLGLALKRYGKSWRGPCPIHGGKGPNFAVDPKRGIFKCFVCDRSGDGIRLWMDVRGVPFVDAVRRLT